MGFLEKLKGSNAYKSFTEKFQELKERQQETEADDQLDERSPYAQIGSIARKVGTASLAVAGAATRSNSMLGNAISAITGIEDRPIGGKPKTDEEYNQMEIESQSGVSRQSGYIPDRFGNPSRKMTQDEADAYLKENPDHKFPEGFEPDQTPFSVSIGMNEAKADELVPKTETPETPQGHDRFIKGILYNENRGAIAAGKDPYQTVGISGDLGKYQTSPATLDDWSEAWLGRKYTPEEFLADPNAQERYFNEFLKVKDSYQLSDEDAALIWHRGWGVLGFQKSREEKEKDLRDYIDNIKDEEISQNYLNSFSVGVEQ